MYFEKDHLGSIRSVLNTSGTVLEKNDYYPFGQCHANSSYVVTANNRFKFNGKEDQTVGALGLLDYGARMYDGYIGRWLGSDPMAYAYYATSPYVYCSNNPINAIDPDGKKIVFINGYLGFGSPKGGAAYWNYSFVKGAQSFFKDNTIPYFTDVKHGKLSSASGRHSKGYQYAKENYADLINGMQEGETFKLVSHSMGGAFATGIQEYLEEQGWIVDNSVFINTYQSGSVKTKKDSHTFIVDYQNTNDPVLFWLDSNLGLGEIKNSDVKVREKSEKGWSYRHKGPIGSGEDFWKELQKIIDEIVNNW